MVNPRRHRLLAQCGALLATVLLCSTPCAAETRPASPTSDCPAPEAITPTHLYGLWQLTLGTPAHPSGEGQVVFRRHPEFAASVRGTLESSVQGGHLRAAQVAGDVTDQGFQLEESGDGTTIDAVWSGDVLPGSCGREIQGWRRVLDGNSTQETVGEQAFLLKKAPGWR